MPRGLAPKLILSVSAIVLVVVGVFAYVNARIQERELLDEVVRATDALSNTITSATWDSMLADHRESAYKVMRTIGRQEGVRRVRIFNKLGRITFSTGDDAGQQVDLSAEACYLCHAAGEPLVKVNAPSRVRDFTEGGHHYLGMVTPIYNEPACSSASCHAHPEGKPVLGVLDISVPLDRVDGEVAGIRLRAVMMGGLTVVLIGGFVVFFSRRFVVRPVRALIDATKDVAAMDLERPVEVRASDELGELGRSFNTMREHLLRARGEIEDFTRNLELKVEERTAELDAARKKLQQSERLASLGRLSASVAHEINNPLSGVLNFSMLMQRLLSVDGVPPDRIEDFRHYLSQVVSETSRAGRIVTDLLSFSRRSPTDLSPTDLNETVIQTLSVLEHRLAEMRAKVELDLTDDLPPAPCDGSRMKQVVTNLVINAAESMPDGGALRVGTRLAPEHDAVLLTVSDDGEGIPEESLTRVFDPFFTTREQGKGVGLGLAVVYGIVESQGGAIDVESSVGKGTTFTVRLPLAGEA